MTGFHFPIYYYLFISDSFLTTIYISKFDSNNNNMTNE